jgi:hypothetical protein
LLTDDLVVDVMIKADRRGTSRKVVACLLCTRVLMHPAGDAERTLRLIASEMT